MDAWQAAERCLDARRRSSVRSLRMDGRKSAAELHVELALVITFAYPTFSSGLPRGSVYMNENPLQSAHSSLEPLSVTPSL